ncbi:methyltransferase [archaeon]|jgi:tRNA (guanine37-N1)-methyltransferase|nr:methyltransferase [archaeon]
MASYDLMGNIAVIKGEGRSAKEKLELAKKLIERPSVKTVVEKVGNVKGRLRTIGVKHILGEKNLIADYKENGCVFRFNVESCYFSPRLSGERKAIAEKVKKKDSVLVMFAGVGVFPIVISKFGKGSRIVGVEIGRDCCKWFEENLKLNKVKNVEVVQGDVKKKIDGSEKFDVVVMARPNLKDSFLEWGLKGGKKGSKLFYYGFCNVDEIDDLVKGLVEEGKGFGRRLKVVEVVKAGDIAPYKFRYRIEYMFLN